MALLTDELDRYGLEERRLGSSDYPTDLPLHEVLVLAKHCAGGLILGFEQTRVEVGVSKAGTDKERRVATPVGFPTPWNHLEAGILFGLGLPLLVFRESSIEGGIFDPGVTDVFIHRMPSAPPSASERAGIAAVFLKWQGKVREIYYR